MVRGRIARDAGGRSASRSNAQWSCVGALVPAQPVTVASTGTDHVQVPTSTKRLYSLTDFRGPRSMQPLSFPGSSVGRAGDC